MCHRGAHIDAWESKATHVKTADGKLSAHELPSAVFFLQPTRLPVWLTGRGRGCLALLVVTMAALFTPVAAAQLSPGPLSKAHSRLSGPAGCTRCHEVSAGSPNFRCLDCHQEIATRLQQKKGMHPVYVGASGGNTSCARCHSEHNGENFALSHWDPSPARFDHSKTGFSLDGKHAGLACAKCHTPDKFPPGERQKLTATNLSHTFLGLSTSCAGCHEDKHRCQLGTNCAQCHNATDWRIARSYDHSKTRFALAGLHAQVACQKCHVPAADGVVKFVGLKFQQCESCHSDPHRGTFQQGCESCHNTAGWKRTSFMARFDHSKTRFALLGRHLEVHCDTCHRGGDFKTPLAFQACADCHKPDPHNGQFAKRADGGRCESCHTVGGFKPAKFELAEHNRTGFPLREKHATVQCAKCHAPSGRATLFKVKFAACTDCHTDAHRGQFARAPYWNRCEKCHTESGFKPSMFTLVRHQESTFVLTGGHIAVACIDCHKPAEAGRTISYHFDALACTTCHSDPHRGEFVPRMQRAAANRRSAGCEACHSTKSWQDLTRFDHDSTKFQLVGTHRAVECAGCHRPPNMERTLMHVNFSSAPAKCEECHEDPHGAQFARADKETRCAECHNTTKWRPSLFDHEKTIFGLKGAHKDVRCAGCHTNVRAVSERKVVFYKPTPTACAACHGATVVVTKGL